MSPDVQPYRPPEATPVGHSGTRVEIRERPAWAISGWIGVLIVTVCVAAVVVLAGTPIPGVAVVPGVVAVVILTSLVIVSLVTRRSCASSGRMSGPCGAPVCGELRRWQTGGVSASGSATSRRTI